MILCFLCFFTTFAAVWNAVVSHAVTTKDKLLYNMKHKFLLFSLLLSVADLSAQEHSIMVISDMHVLDNSLWNQENPEIFYSDPKMVEHSAELFDMAVERILERRPDILLIPGDLTYNGERKSHQYVAEQLTRIQANGTQVFVIPGNHDVSNPLAKDFSSGKGVKTDNLSALGFAELYADFGYNNAVLRLDSETDSLSYMAYPTDDIAVIGLNSNLSNVGGQKSAGCITEGTLNFLLESAGQAIADGHSNILVMVHHPIMEHIDKQSMVDASHIVNIGEEMIPISEIQDNLTSAHIHAVFTGHGHLHTISRVPTASGDLYDISTGSLCAFPSPIRYGILNTGTGNLAIASELIDTYLQEGCERDTVLAKAAVNTVVEKIYPKIDNLKKMIDSDPKLKLLFSGGAFSNVDKDGLKLIVWLYMGKEIHHAFTSLSRGDEDAGIYFDTDSAYNAALSAFYSMATDMVGMDVEKAMPLLQPILAKMGINIDSSITPEAILGSIYYNYVTIDGVEINTPDASCTTLRSINVREGTVSAVDDVYMESSQSEKRFENGQIVIYRSGRKMNLLGQEY